MKRKNKTLLTLMLAGTLCAATVGGVAGMLPTASAYSPAEPKTYALTDIFSANATGVIGARKKADADQKETAAFTLAKGNTVEFRRDLAFKWYESANEASYMSLEFTFGDTNFTDVSFVIETAPAQSTENDKAINTIKFTNEDGNISVGVLHGDEETAASTKQVDGTDVTIALDEGTQYGEFAVLVNGENVGYMTNVGANFADSGTLDSLVIKAGLEGNDTTTLYLNSINGQRFDNITEENSRKMVADTAAPVLVVNEELSGFLLGTAFSLDYEKIDVLKSSSISETKKYYQYNPADTAVPEEDKKGTLTTSTYFMDTVYYTNGTEYSKEAKEGYTKTSVFNEEKRATKKGKEYVSIEITLGDDTFTGEYKKTYDLSWYATNAVTKQVGGTDVSFIVLDRNEEGAKYSYITADEESKTNIVDEALETAVANYTAKLTENAENVYAGSNAEINLPAVDWLISDNNGYQSLKFTISYKTPSSSTASTSSSLDYDELEITTANEGWYEFKIFATDAAGNTMKYYLEEELVSVTSSNVWDIEEIPSFTFEIKNRGIKVADGEDGDTLDTKILDETYTMTDFKIIGASNESSEYVLYKLDLQEYNKSLADGKTRLTNSILSDISFDALRKEVENTIPTVTDGNYFEIYKKAYAKLVAEEIGATAEEVAVIFTEIAEYDSRITEDDKDAWEASDNKYNWSATSRSFKAVEEGLYMILADYWDEDLAFIDRVPAYQLIEVDAEADSIVGESNWLENNVVSVVLFSIAGVLLVIIIILLLVKPSDETLEDVDAKAAAKKAEKKNK